ncbi:MAG: ATP synthase F0 subunit B [Candidatus Omnitrophica bacterium CG11_big_fil_rev_8_21_14_0_20_64_10]|nr:MAG: ATP synthase F0 subunit B [Candidatus Omnitrophica bacterium CG11_big_fil_rev_8_21_14_0_20_64_10]
MEIDPKQILIHAAGFLILLAILKKFAWGALLSAMEARSAKIAGEFDLIERNKQEMEKLKADYQAQLARIEEEARGKIQAAVAEGRKLAGEIEEEARAHARETFEKSREQITLELQKARIQLKEQIVDLAIQVNHKILARHLDEETDRRMIEGFIQEINQLDASAGSGKGAGR